MKHLAEQYPLPMPVEYKGPTTLGRVTISTADEPEPGLKIMPALPKPTREGTDERKHHRHGMSVLNYIAACPGFQGKGGTNEAAEDGQRLHDIMEKVARLLASDIERNGVLSATTNLEIVLKTETVSEDEDFYLKFCCKELDVWLAKKPVKILTEQRVHIRNPDGSTLNFGHYDLLLFLTEETAILFDYKFGWIPVPPAESNWQGKGYAVGNFQEIAKLRKLGVIFIQPKLHQITRAMYERKQLFAMYEQVRDVIRAALAPNKKLSIGPYCDFCGIAGTCKALINDAQRAVAIHEGLPMPQSFVGLQIETPEEAAKALYVVDRLSRLIEESGLKEKARELARQNNGVISCPLPNGETVVAELKYRNAPRSANSPALIADTLKEVLTPEQVLDACEPRITRLEEIFADAMVEKAKAEAQAVLDEAEKSAAANPAQAKEIRKAAEAEAKTIRMTKKRAVEILRDTLTSEGLLSAPEGRVEYLKMRVEKHIKNITDASHSNHQKTSAKTDAAR